MKFYKYVENKITGQLQRSTEQQEIKKLKMVLGFPNKTIENYLHYGNLCKYEDIPVF